MKLGKAPSWTDFYYSIVEYYFWRPQLIGRIKHPELAGKRWTHWEQKLRSQEAPLNHILDLFFHFAPQRLLDIYISELLNRHVTGLDLVYPQDGAIDYNIVQPDIILRNNNSLIFIEMKVDSKSSLDQFAKYAIASNWLISNDSSVDNIDLIVLSRYTSHDKVWQRSSNLGISSTEAVKRITVEGLKGNRSVWRQRAVPKFLETYSNSIKDVIAIVDKMNVTLTDYQLLYDSLQKFAASETIVEDLISGVLDELEKRELATAKQ